MKEEIHHLFQKKNIESATRFFLQNLKGHYYYFKWMETECALKLVHSSPPYKTKIIRLYESHPQFDMAQLKKPEQIACLKFIQKLSPDKKLKARLISVRNQAFAVLFSENTSDLLVECFENHCELLSWKNQCMSFSNNDSFLKTLYGEISRARRLRHPVSLLLIRFQIQSETNKELFFKSFLNHLRKNNRMYDTLAQISSDEIACILPHTSEKGSIEKAQKIHHMLENLTQKNILNPEIKFQVAVAEYPTVGRDAVSLLHIARQSCANEKNLGICVAQIPVAFRPDFLVPPVDEMSLSELT